MEKTDIDLLSMFMLGLLGSGHCLGMCGPLIVALPGRYGSWHAHGLYHLGRLATYMLVGALFGAVHQGMTILSGLTETTALDWVPRIQVAFSLLAALFLLIMGLGRLGLLREPAWMASASPQKIPGFDAAMQRTLNRRNAASLLLVGLLLGLLPCGLSYGAFARALAAESIFRGAALTGSFGLGTLPALLILGTGAMKLFQRYRAHTELLTGLLMIGMALGLVADAWGALT